MATYYYIGYTITFFNLMPIYHTCKVWAVTPTLLTNIPRVIKEEISILVKFFITEQV